ncbi:MAG: hypothetical protein DWH97_00565 [Planctomycetota bacterium]|nr:MAG: hypothetical protein DWH97_00565 [Planctomycetota bacterium]
MESRNLLKISIALDPSQDLHKRMAPIEDDTFLPWRKVLLIELCFVQCRAGGSVQLMRRSGTGADFTI